MATSRSTPERHHDLATFSLSDMLLLGKELRRLGRDARSMEEASRELVQFFYDRLTDAKTGERCCALVRCFKTHPYGTLPEDLKAFARKVLGGSAPEDEQMRCLTLLATAGDKAEWNDRRRSAGHQAIPLPSVEIVSQAPMVSQLIQQMGLEISAVLNPSPELLVDAEQRSFNVFHVAEANGSPYVPAQSDFVKKERIASVLGFGGLMPSGDLFSVIMFSRAHIERATADMFSTLALGVKLALLPFARGPFFEENAQ